LTERNDPTDIDVHFLTAWAGAFCDAFRPYVDEIYGDESNDPIRMAFNEWPSPDLFQRLTPADVDNLHAAVQEWFERDNIPRSATQTAVDTILMRWFGPET